MLEEAFRLALIYHGNQQRKVPVHPNAPRAPYLSHLMEVAGMVQAVGAPIQVVEAALLHDLLEDTDGTYEDIVEVCGRKVADLVQECTEVGTTGSQKAPWQERKEAYLAHIVVISAPALLICVADKLQSLRETWRQYRQFGDKAFENLVFGTLQERKAKTLWFQNALMEQWRKRLEALKQENNNDLLLYGVSALLMDFAEVLNNFAE